MLKVAGKELEHEITDCLQAKIDSQLKSMLKAAKKVCAEKAGQNFDDITKTPRTAKAFDAAGITRETFIADAVSELNSIKL
jgi:hypothetical protein